MNANRPFLLIIWSFGINIADAAVGQRRRQRRDRRTDRFQDY